MNDKDPQQEINVRSWCLDYSIKANKKGTPADKIISDAQKFYGFIFPNNGKVTELKKKGDGA